jgi:UDP-N-acetylmuramate dehydrogenase
MGNIIEKIKNNVSLAAITTYQIGGVAKFFVEPETEEELKEVIAWAKGNGEKVFILGGGSNVLISDNGLNGVVIRLANRNIEIKGDRIHCGAGANLVSVARKAVSNSLSGLEWSIGIPGASIGGSVRGNAGAFGSSMADLVETIVVFDKEKKEFINFSNKDCNFVYRGSTFKDNPNLFVWEVVLRLHHDKKEIIDKKVLSSLEHRTKIYPKLPSAGSVFKSITFADIQKDSPNLADRLINSGYDPKKNVSAGLLIDWAGLKGKKIGGAKVSLEHGNFIVNTGKASAEDIIMLVSYIKEKIRNNFGIQLHEEIQYLGFD